MHTLLIAVVAGFVGAIAGYVASEHYGARVTNRIHAMNAVFQTWGDHIASDARSITERGSGAIAAVEAQIKERDAAFKAWVATL